VGSLGAKKQRECWEPKAAGNNLVGGWGEENRVVGKALGHHKKKRKFGLI